MSGKIPDIEDYFPELSSDLSQITWGHAINNQQQLQGNLSNKTVMMLEADVLLGHIEETDTDKEPIMAHPPKTTSDISLQMWIDQVITAVNQGKNKKGVKLDFKQLAVVMKSLNILGKQKDKINFPLLLNADILDGPGNPTNKPVESDTFLSLCSEFFPEATLSIGWTTKFNSADDLNGIYTMNMVYEMITEIKKNSISQPITFPIRAAFVGRSLESLQYLIDNVKNSTLTIWSSATDIVDIQSLVDLQKFLGSNKIYYDLPAKQQKQFDRIRNQLSTTEDPESLSSPMFSFHTSFILITISIVLISLVYHISIS